MKLLRCSKAETNQNSGSNSPIETLDSTTAAGREIKPEPTTPPIDPSITPFKSEEKEIPTNSEEEEMAENVQPASGSAGADGQAGVPFYEQQRKHLKEIIAKKRALERQLVSLRTPPSPLSGAT